MRGTGSRLAAATLVVGLVAAACAPTATPSVTNADPGAGPTASTGVAPESATTVTTTGAPTTTVSGATGVTTTTRPDRATYFVVAEEEGRRLAIIEAGGGCAGSDGGCSAPVALVIELAERPHNLAAADGVIFVTHPAAGSVSRVDPVTGSIVTSVIGTEPHDVKYAPSRRRLYVADESGRRIIGLDPDTLAVLETVGLPGEPHDMAVAGDDIWVTMVGRSDLARITEGGVDFFATSGSPHDLVVEAGTVWFSNWGSAVLSVFDPTDSSTMRAPAGVAEPHHFAIAPDGVVWVSDNGGSSIVGFTEPQIAVEVGPVPHHLAFAGDTIVVAVSGSGQAVQVRGGRVVGRTQLTPGLHGVTVIETGRLPGA